MQTSTGSTSQQPFVLSESGAFFNCPACLNLHWMYCKSTYELISCFLHVASAAPGLQLEQSQCMHRSTWSASIPLHSPPPNTSFQFVSYAHSHLKNEDFLSEEENCSKSIALFRQCIFNMCGGLLYNHTVCIQHKFWKWVYTITFDLEISQLDNTCPVQ